MTVQNDAVRGKLAEIAAYAISEAWEIGISPEDIVVLDYDPDYDVIFIDHLTPNVDNDFGYPACFTQHTQYAIDGKTHEVVNMDCKCRGCGQDFTPTTEAVKLDHDINNYSYGPTPITATLNTLEWCSNCV